LSNSLYDVVRRGARLLDREAPGWERKIDLDTLDLEHTCNCVVGQVYGDYDEGIEQLDGDAESHPERYGFDIDPAADYEYESLTERWRGFLKRRLSRVAA
jgi:hypothetical protein